MENLVLSNSKRSPVAAAAMLAAVAVSALVPASALAADKTVLVVLAASSTKGAITDDIALFEKSHPNVTVSVTFAGSKVIAAQLAQGAAADVILIADPVMQDIKGSVDGATPVVRNHTTIIATKAAAAKIHGPADMVAAGIRLGGGTANSNIAKLTEETLAKMGSRYGADYASKYAAHISTTKTDNAKLAALVASGGVDAAILFPSDMVPGETVEVPLAERDRVEEMHDIAVVKSSKNAGLAKEFAALVMSSEGKDVFRRHHHDAI
jgi:molybdate transport system substrate-binding protein